MSSSTWQELVPGAWVRTYANTTGVVSNSVALRTRDGGVALFSPSVAPTEEDFAAAEALGPVEALVATNSGHDGGQLPWQARFPDAGTFAPAAAAPAVTKAKPGTRPLAPFAALAERLPAAVRLEDVPGTSSGMTLFTVDAGDARLLFLDELVSNQAELTGPWPFRVLFRLTGSGPGLARNKIWLSVFCKDRPGVARRVLEGLDAAPTHVLPAHGGALTGDAVAGVRALLAPLV